MTSQARAFQQMLLLTRSVLCANLLAVDTLHGEALGNETVSYVSDGGGGFRILRKTANTVTHLVIFLGAELHERSVDFLVDGAAHDGDK